MKEDQIYFFFSGWEPILRIIVVGTLTYIAILFLLRISGKRTLAQMTGFDFLITVAMGAAFGRILTAKSVSISEAITVFVLLVLLQYLFSYFNVHFKNFKNFVTAQPTLLFYQGKFLEGNLNKTRVSKEELKDEVRKKGISSMQGVEVIIFERNGGFSIIETGQSPNKQTYTDLVEKEKKENL